MTETLIVVGVADPTHVGAHFWQAARHLTIPVTFCDVREASGGARWWRRFNWHLLGHRPTRLVEFSEKVVRKCREFRPTFLLATGLAPLTEAALCEIRGLGIACVNYLTDDPWNRAHYAPWFLRALRKYHYVFSPRRANCDALVRWGCANVSYLPFAYSPDVHFPDRNTNKLSLMSSVVFAGGADHDRLPYITALLRAGIRVSLYGAYWDRYTETRSSHLGFADSELLRKAVTGAGVNLCLVRRANRDGHSMRSFEIPAMCGCMLTEDTAEHRQIFGDEGEAVRYFSCINELVEKVRWLLVHEGDRARLAMNAHMRIVNEPNTYRDRLLSMLASEARSVK